MDRNKKFSKWVPVATIEMVFWFSAIFVAIFINISSRALSSINIGFTTLLLFAFLVIILSRILPRLDSPGKRRVFIFGVGVVVAITFLLIAIGSTHLVTFFYLPASIAISMTVLVILDPLSPIIILVGVCTFILGEAFWSIHIIPGQGLRVPATFFRVFSLTAVTLFTYYLFRKERFVRGELALLNKKLKSLDVMKSKFVANASHELRSPLTSIRTATALLKKKLSKDAKTVSISEEELIEIITSNIDRQSNLITALLDLSKIEKGKIALRRVPTNLGMIAREILKSMVIQAKGKNIEIITDIPEELSTIYAAEGQIAEVYSNLLDNAIKFTGENGKIYLRIREIEEGVESSVEDTGIGVAQEDLGKIFDKFVQLQDVVKHKDRGIGLGLVITKEIIESQGGKIWVESKLGVGSKFIFRLPRGLRDIDRRREGGHGR